MAVEQGTAVLGGAAVGLDLGCCLWGDNRADIGAQIPRITQPQLVHGADQLRDKALRHILLHIKAAQRRAPLARRLKGRGQDILDRLLRQGR